MEHEFFFKSHYMTLVCVHVCNNNCVCLFYTSTSACLANGHTYNAYMQMFSGYTCVQVCTYAERHVKKYVSVCMRLCWEKCERAYTFICTLQ